MLMSLSIQNVVLIDQLDLDFSKDLNVFTGETGAGKSILLDSLSLALGARSDAGLVKHETSHLVVTAQFRVSKKHPLSAVFEEQELPFEEDLILRRIVYKDGRSKAFVNDQAVSVSFLRTVGEMIAEIHGQFAAHRLLDPREHIKALDHFAGLENFKNTVAHAFENWKAHQKKTLEITGDLEKALQEEEFLKENLAILEKLNPKPGEEEELAEKRQMMMNMEKISAALQTARHVLENDETGVEGALSQAVRGIEKANELAQDKFAGILSAVMAAQENIADALGNLSQEMDGLEDVSSLSEIDDRLFALKDMARRHHVTVAELIPLKETLREKLDLLNTGTHRLAEAEKKEQQARLAYIEQAMALSKERHRAGERLDALVAQELPDLKLGQAVFKTQISSKTEEEFTADGIDEAVFLVSTNKGVPPAPIHKVASGGELARFMLALKLNLRGEGEMMTLIFDEVDSGVGGMTADAVGNRLKRLSKECQVLVVTHSPQVAAYGKHHYQVSKETAGDKTKTTVALLSTKARREEIARMLSGARVTESSLNAAAELLEHACKSPSLN